jgi:hypothetical protein
VAIAAQFPPGAVLARVAASVRFREPQAFRLQQSLADR